MIKIETQLLFLLWITVLRLYGDRTTLVTAATIISTVDNGVSTPRETRKDNWYPVKEDATRNPEGQLIPGKADATRNPEVPIGTRYHTQLCIDATRNPEGQLVPGKADATRNPEVPIGTRYHTLVYLLSA